MHRVGRTARMGACGRAVTLYTPPEHRDVRKLAIPAGTGHRRLLCRLSFIFLPVFWGVFVFAIAYQGPPDACAGGE